MTHAPALFVSHGAPTFALEPGLLGPNLAQLGARLPGLAAIAVVSAHWQTTGVQVMRTAAPDTVHDFGGFPPVLYRLRYPAPGAPAIAAEAAALLNSAGIDTTFDDGRGIDHGVWVPLLHLLPKAQVPVFQISLPFDGTAEHAVRLGRALGPLRRRGVLVMGSGSLTHNLGDIGRVDPSLASYVAEFTDWVRIHVQNRDTQALVEYRRRAPHAKRAHPSEEHFLPLLVAVGASEDADAVTVIEGGVTYGVLSMESFAFEIGQSEARLGAGAAV
jgi:4,5-DOPA dioxygenase extradiol